MKTNVLKKLFPIRQRKSYKLIPIHNSYSWFLFAFRKTNVSNVLSDIDCRLGAKVSPAIMKKVFQQELRRG